MNRRQRHVELVAGDGAARFGVPASGRTRTGKLAAGRLMGWRAKRSRAEEKRSFEDGGQAGVVPTAASERWRRRGWMQMDGCVCACALGYPCRRCGQRGWLTRGSPSPLASSRVGWGAAVRGPTGGIGMERAERQAWLAFVRLLFLLFSRGFVRNA